MIQWKDFILDDIFGPLLFIPEVESEVSEKIREERLGDASIKEDAKIQETGQVQRLARMAGQSDSESKSGMEAGRIHVTSLSRTGGRG